MYSVTVLRDERVRARKEHYCDTCGSIIKPTEEYNRQTNVLDDSIYTWKNCDYCEELRSEAWDYYYKTWGITCMTRERFYNYIVESGVDFKPRE